MSYRVHLISKAVKVIKSCKTPEHMRCAERFCDLVLRAHQGSFEFISIRDDIIASFRTLALEKELQDLRCETAARMVS